MQESVDWTPPQGTLGRLVTQAHARVDVLKERESELEGQAAAIGSRPSFVSAIRDADHVALIAEIKRSSPSQGAIAPTLDAAEQAAAYAKGGATAISVLTEPDEFAGSINDLSAAAPVGLPLLRKDFIVDRVQLFEAVVHGASAALLIVRAIPPDRFRALHAEAVALGLAALVEVHTDDELHIAIDAGCAVIGVNNRDLESLAVDPAVSARLLPHIPPSVVAVYESGIRSREDVERAAALGADAVLVGTALSGSGDVSAAVRHLVGVPKRGRRGS